MAQRTKDVTPPPGEPASDHGDELVSSETRPGKATARPPAAVPPPEALLGREFGPYRVLELIGEGGMGRVYRGEHTELGRPVALKLLRPELTERKEAVARFFQEAKAVNKIRHRNIVDVTDLIKSDDGLVFIVMELLSGTTLGALHRTQKPLPISLLLEIAIQLAAALGAAHSVNIVHRDLKPDNVFLVPDGEGGQLVKVLDFGIAKLNASDKEPLATDDFAYRTAEGSVVGTPAYMSPEQAAGLPVDGRSDIYSLGAILYELLCDQPPFTGKSFGEFVVKHLNERPLPPSARTRRDIPHKLESLVMKCLEKDAPKRFQTMSEIKAAVRDILEDMGIPLPAGVAVSQSVPASVLQAAIESDSLPHRVMTSQEPLSSGWRTPQKPQSSTESMSPQDGRAAQQLARHMGSAGSAVSTTGDSAAVPFPLTTSTSTPNRQAVDPAEAPRRSTHPALRGTERTGNLVWWVLTGLILGLLALLLLRTAPSQTIRRGALPTDAADASPQVTPLQGVAEPRLDAAGPVPPTVIGEPATPTIVGAPATIFVTTRPEGAEVRWLHHAKTACVTPCEVVLDPATGGPPEVWRLLVRLPGYTDEILRIPIDGPARRDSSIALSRRAPGESDPEPDAAPEPVFDATPLVDAPSLPDAAPAFDSNKGPIDRTETLNPFSAQP